MPYQPDIRFVKLSRKVFDELKAGFATAEPGTQLRVVLNKGIQVDGKTVLRDTTLIFTT